MARIPSYKPEAINRRIARIKALNITPATAKSVASYYSNVLESPNGANAGFVKSYEKAKADTEKVRRDFGDNRPFTKDEYMAELKELVSNPEIQTTVNSSINYINTTGRANIKHIKSEWFKENNIDEDEFREMIEKMNKREFVAFIDEAAEAGKSEEDESKGSSGGFAKISTAWIEAYKKAEEERKRNGVH